MMSDDIRIMPEIYEIYPTLSSILRKYERYGRKDYFRGQSAEEFMTWRMRKPCDAMGAARPREDGYVRAGSGNR